MVMEIKASSCWNSKELIEDYGDKLKMFNTTVDGVSIENVKLPEDEEECFEKTVKIEIKSLEELRDLIGTFGTIIMNNNSIEIYDDYRE